MAVFATVGLFSNHAEASVKPMPKQEEANKLVSDNGKFQNSKQSTVNKNEECVPYENVTTDIDIIPLEGGGTLICIDIEVTKFNADCTSSYSWSVVCF